MRRTALAAALGVALAGLAAVGVARAETLSLLCHVRETRADGAHRQLLRRIDLDMTQKSVRFSDNLGRGWVFKRQGAFVSADAKIIRLDAGGGKDSYIDRISGQYYFHNARNGLTIRGPCEKASAARPKF